MELNKLQRRRGGIRGAITKIKQKIDELVQVEAADINKVVLEAQVERLVLKQDELILLDRQIEDLVSDDDLESEREGVEMYEDQIAMAKAAAKQMLQLCAPSANVQTQSSGNQTNTRVKLPKLELSRFNGSLTLWQGFWDRFKSAVDNNSSLAAVDKLTYLVGLLDEPAASTLMGLSITEVNYPVAVKLLKERYGRKDLVVNAHIRQLLDLKPMNVRNPLTAELRRVHDTCQAQIRALEALGVTTAGYETMLLPGLLRLLTNDLQREWCRRIQTKSLTNNLMGILKFLQGELENCERLQEWKLESNQYESETRKFNTNNTKVERFSPRPTTASLLVGAEAKDPCCQFCKRKNHAALQCREFKEAEMRRQRVRELGLCFCCLKDTHRAKQCPDFQTLCSNCGRRHHRALCTQQEAEYTQAPKSVVSSVVRLSSDEIKEVRLQTAQVWIQGTKGWTQIRCLLDGGSERTFIETDLRQALNAPVVGKEHLQVHGFGKDQVKTSVYKKVALRLVGQYGGPVLEIEALEAPRISTVVLAKPDKTQIQRMERIGLQSADPLAEKEEHALPVELLIGADWYWRIVTGKIRRFTESLVAAESIFGWLLQGTEGNAVHHKAIQVMHVAVDVPKNREEEWKLRSLWDTHTSKAEEYDHKRQRSLEENKVLEEFTRTIQFHNGRYNVRLPWKEEVHELQDNWLVARRRLDQLVRQLRKDPKLWQRYDNAIEAYIQDGHAEIVDESKEVNGPVFYMPHRAVIREDRATTKLRVVFDASSHANNALSLNDCLYTGPNLNPEIMEVLLRFRRYRVAFTADIEKAFLQVELASEDRNATRFMWLKPEDESSLLTMRMTQVLFGAKPSPFLLVATIRHNAQRHQEQQSEACCRLADDLYVDDLISGAGNDNEALKLYQDIKDVSEAGGMPLKKWVTNSRALREVWEDLNESQYPFKEMSEGEDETGLKVLGIRWEPKEDVFCFQNMQLEQEAYPTKRTVLHDAARLFDPLGLIEPIRTVGKVLLQQLWKRDVGWDEPIPADLKSDRDKWQKLKARINRIKVRRWLHIEVGLAKSQLHIFCDASEASYGAVAYIRAEHQGVIQVTLVASKGRVAPIRRITLPRLELLATVVGARLGRYVLQALQLPEDVLRLWTDSQIALQWIRSEVGHWKTFVANRVGEVQATTNRSAWRFCPGSDNPADILTRVELVSKIFQPGIWWVGPKWLCESETNWPEDSYKQCTEGLTELKNRSEGKNCVVKVVRIRNRTELLQLKRINNYNKAVRSIAWVLRFVQACKKQSKVKGCLTAEEFELAEQYWFKVAQEDNFQKEIDALDSGKPCPPDSKISQFRPFLDPDGILRVGSRLGEALFAEEAKYPVLLPAQSDLTELIIWREHQRRFHAGVRQTLASIRSRFWIISGRSLTKKVLNKCVICQRLRAAAATQKVGPLPTERMEETTAFRTAGIDFAGPLFIKNGNNQRCKVYILLITCATSRALHLELTRDQTTEQVLMALRRFFARRGVSETLYSDNAQAFHKADKEIQRLYQRLKQAPIQDYCASRGVKWKFIVEKAAWWGGFWERMVQSVKRSLRKSLGKALLTYDELETVLVEVEAVLNSRPLTYLYSDPREGEPLTPAHLLSGARLTSLPSRITRLENLDSSAKGLTRRWIYRQKLSNQFWVRWRKEYLLDLRTAHQLKDPPTGRDLQVGDLVLINEPRLPRHLWRTGRIITVISGRDGCIRSCHLRTNLGQELRRPIQLLYPLETQ